ncbi:Egg cell-secreted protein 1.4 [Heracleum sosnowskyi]|uniref:Egg cell-secreted protein 1.4 n=1 Tax=Heracleum sosnowskyi TaxID=360622 RepID=A0AAD8JGR9_9APIA|nr:Egg cell-secreted protein 1.4 [Heracleum sosnowskyi]
MAPKNLQTTITMLSCLLLVLNATCYTSKNVDIAGRLEGEGDTGECWNALLDLKSCSNEIVLFLLNGESYLGMDCCRAIRTITHGCWPSMFSSLGFTSAEADILRDYCTSKSPPQPTALMESMVSSPAEAPIEAPAQAPMNA